MAQNCRAQSIAKGEKWKRQFEIQDVNIRVSRSAIKVMADSPDKWRPQTHQTADHNMPYSAEVALMYGTVALIEMTRV
jgi:2-methylcitrate dehydratase PrpD